jgi:hypothetical protein
VSHKKPARIIKITNRSVSGVVPDMGQYESSLERDFMQMVRFDNNIESFEAQPITISYLDSLGKQRKYTPDGLIKFKPALQLPNTLFEIKYREDFRQDWKVLIPKFRAAKQFCEEQFWRFEVYTDREIRTPYLENVKFLWQYLKRTPDISDKERVLQLLSDLEETDPDMLLCALCRVKSNRAYMIPIIWHLTAIGEIGCDLEQPLTMRSRIWYRGTE